MQTFLPYPSFAASSAALDTARLGKQRVETMQILRALLLPSYGWQNHPVTRMWRGHVPALTAYGLANVAAWVARGHADSTRDLIAEFAPEVDGVAQEVLAARGLLPSWIGDEALHRSHRSSLLRKDPAFYAPVFPGTPPDLDYVWPDPGERPAPPDGVPLWVVRARSADELDQWREEGIIAIGDRTSLGRDTPKWRAQLAEFVDALEPGSAVGVLVGNDHVLQRARVTGDVQLRQLESGAVQLVRGAEYDGELARTDFAVPAVLQDPRTVFVAQLRAP